MLKFSSFLVAVVLICSCTISAEQENRLNKQLSKFIKAHNDNNTLEYAGLTHPLVVKYYTSLGDSSFITHFSNQSGENEVSFNDPLFRDMKSEGKWIERKYTVNKESYEERNKNYELYAVSSDGGNNWFFLTEDDYFQQKIPLKRRLFSK
ncbi:hypothetical protein [Fluviicola sp.]|uniref:hypothetical protein n=1 Tax=Fluviicola sp. TaxID=1917219 RepID=UPI0031DD29FC